MSKFKLQRTQELTRTQHEDGKQDAWNGHAQVASQAMAVPEEYAPDAERQEVKRDEQESRTAQQQVKKMTLGRARRERSVIINEYESDKTSRTKRFSQLQTWRNHSLNATRKEVDEKIDVSIRRKLINDGTKISKKMKRTIDERDSEVPRREQGEQGKAWRTKNRKCIRCANARDDKRTGSPTENHSFTERKHDTEEKLEDKFV